MTVISAYSPLWLRRAQQVLAKESPVMWRLPGLATKVSQQLIRTGTARLTAEAGLPKSIAAALNQKGITTVKFLLASRLADNEVVENSFRTATQAVFRHLALAGPQAAEINFSSLFPNSHFPEISPYSGKVVIAPQPTGEITVNVSANFHPIEELSPSHAPARKIAKQILGQLPSRNLFSLSYWRSRLTDIVMSDPALVEIFSNLTDTFVKLNNRANPSLKHRVLAFGAASTLAFPAKMRRNLPLLLQLGLWLNDFSLWGTRFLARSIFYLGFKIASQQASRQFIAGETIAQTNKTIKQLHQQGVGYIADLVVEGVHDQDRAKSNLDNYLALLDQLPTGGERVISIKLTGLVADFCFNKIQAALEVLMVLAQKAKEKNALVVIDMEEFYYKDITLDIFKEFHRRTNFQYANNLGVVLQTYLKSSLADTRGLLHFGRECAQATRGAAKLFIRLVKGAYPKKDHDYVLPREQVDDHFINCLRLLASEASSFRLAIGSHNPQTITRAIALFDSLGLDPRLLEFEMLHGMSTAPLLFRLAELGYPTRFYLPKGDFTESRLYFIRRLEENSSATSCQKLFRLFYQGYLTVKDYLDGVFRPLDTKAEGTAHYIIAA